MTPASPASRSRYYFLLVVLCAGLLLTVQFVAPSRSELWIRTLFNALHLPLFSVVALIVYTLVARFIDAGFYGRLAWAAVIAMALGVFSEAVQIPGARDSSIWDLGANWLGVGVGLSVIAVFSPQSPLSRPTRLGTAILAVVACAVVFWPTFRVAAAYVDRNSNVPILYDFDSKVSAPLLSLKNARLDIVPGVHFDGPVGQVTFGDGCWPSLVLRDVWPRWGDYSNLLIELENPESSPLVVFVRVNDQAHMRGNQPSSDRFTAAFSVSPGLSRIPVPLEMIREAPETREMDMDDIHAIVVFGDCDSAGRRISVANLQLEIGDSSRNRRSR